MPAKVFYLFFSVRGFFYVEMQFIKDQEPGVVFSGEAGDIRVTKKMFYQSFGKIVGNARIENRFILVGYDINMIRFAHQMQW